MVWEILPGIDRWYFYENRTMKPVEVILEHSKKKKKNPSIHDLVLPLFLYLLKDSFSCLSKEGRCRHYGCPPI
jgi:hypothetical protein